MNTTLSSLDPMSLLAHRAARSSLGLAPSLNLFPQVVLPQIAPIWSTHACPSLRRFAAAFGGDQLASGAVKFSAPTRVPADCVR
jgi:hypothetical protein